MSFSFEGSRRSSPRGDASAPTRVGRRRAFPLPFASPPPEWPAGKLAGRKDGGGGASLEGAAAGASRRRGGGGGQIRGGGSGGGGAEEVAAATRRRWRRLTGRRRRWRRQQQDGGGAGSGDGAGPAARGVTGSGNLLAGSGAPQSGSVLSGVGGRIPSVKATASQHVDDSVQPGMEAGKEETGGCVGAALAAGCGQRQRR
ncbi:hypothetical protein OsJ_14720 [Oryza sativa Japonica Group]|uniref:Uncharacterized protein n=1 Tax=Oryza sativa subsp. japonica TaxID=39947 RepID=A3ATM6_ORYSJ|nr:hypothetical protein OsJ_14720 [Oryza sativa Japonica Group]